DEQEEGKDAAGHARADSSRPYASPRDRPPHQRAKRSTVEELEPLRRGELVAQGLVVRHGERLVGSVAPAAPEDGLIGNPVAVEVLLLQIPHQDLLRLRVLELGDDADEIGKPLAVHATAAHLPLAELEEADRVERSARAELDRHHDELVGY